MNDYARLFQRAHHIQHKIAHLAVNLTEQGTSITQKKLDKIIDQMIDLAKLPIEKADDQVYDECVSLYADVYERYESAEGVEFHYWQGKKDGMRTVLAMLAPTSRQSEAWTVLQDTSEGL